MTKECRTSNDEGFCPDNHGIFGLRHLIIPSAFVIHWFVMLFCDEICGARRKMDAV
jgi:hypothetical protein